MIYDITRIYLYDLIYIKPLITVIAYKSLIGREVLRHVDKEVAELVGSLYNRLPAVDKDECLRNAIRCRLEHRTGRSIA